MLLTPKENLLRTLCHAGPAWVPYEGEGSWSLADMQGRRPPQDGLDEWGVTWAPLPSSYVAGADEPLSSYPCAPAAGSLAEWLDRPLPEVSAPARYAGLGDGIDTAEVLLVGRHPAGPLDRLVSLLGMEEAMLSLVRDPQACREALDRIAAYHVQVARGYLAAGAEAAFLADDYAGQDGPFLRPALWQKTVLPALARMIAVYRAAGVPVIFHTCGRADAFLPDLIDAGVVAFNLETAACDLVSLKSRFGDRMGIYGGVSGRLMLEATPDGVRAAARAAIRDLGCDGGLILAPDQPLAFPPENLAALAESARAYGRYPLAM